MYFDDNSYCALIFDDVRIDSKQIRKSIDDMKERIFSQISKPCNTVAIALPRSPEYIVCIFALLEMNITFVPIDISLSIERTVYMLENGNVDYIIINQEINEKLKFDNWIDLRVIKPQSNELKVYGSENDIAYIFFTSGSTGKPKAVEIKSSSLKNFMEAMTKEIDFCHGKKILCSANFTFDIFILESILALSNGLTVVLANEEERTNPRKLIKLIKRHEIDIIQMTPSALQFLALCDKNYTFLETVGHLLIGGESFPRNLLNKLRTKTHAKIYNLYGPTETTIWSTISELTNKEDVDIGHPIKNTAIFLLGSDMEPVKTGEIGEICIAGEGLATGYRNNDDQTDLSFQYLDDSERTRIYKSGDLGKFNESGCLIYIGRVDNQIKLRGHRIELDDIDHNIMEIDNELVTVTCLYDEGIFSELVTFCSSGHIFSKDSMIEALEKKLPDYMIPKRFIEVGGFEYTRSGKIDREALVRNNLLRIRGIDR